jgi:hypothetical protein
VRNHRRPSSARTWWTILVLACAIAQAQTWSWFVEPFTVTVDVATPGLPDATMRLAVAAAAVRMDLDQAGATQSTVLMLDGDGVVVTSILPDGTSFVQRYAGAALPEVFDEGFVTAVTPPDHPQHPCVLTPDVLRCERLGPGEVDGVPTVRWRVESRATGHGQVVDVGAGDGLVRRAVDDGGAVLSFRDHLPGPPPPDRFDVP